MSANHYLKSVFVAGCFVPFLLVPVALAGDRAVAPNANTQENCAQTKSDSKIFHKKNGDTRAIEERKKCFSSHFDSEAKPGENAVRGERVMQPEYGAGANSHEAAHTVQQKPPKPERASGYLKIGDIKGESKD